MKFLARLAESSDQNKMTAANLAIVFVFGIVLVLVLVLYWYHIGIIL